MNTHRKLHFPESHYHEYIDGELSVGDREIFDEHLKSCRPCQSELQRLTNLFHDIESLPAVDIGRDLSSAVLTRIGAARGSSRRWRLVLASQVVVSALLFWLAWPLAEPYFQASQQVDWQSLVSEAGLIFSAHLENLNDSAALFVEQAASQIETSLLAAELEIVESLVLPLLTSASIMWLVGNRLLLNSKNQYH
ncbi:MAG: zf-HC2 domain-containing protein [Anaerolineae bacterium]|nr:zf-HC2 domain-containing protein [Anaerolineae bacterium]